MDKDCLESLVQQGLGIRPIAKQLESSPTNVRYWLHKYGLKVHQKSFRDGYLPPVRPHKCTICGEVDPAKFYGHKRKTCATCQNAYNIKKGQDNRWQAINAKGGCCTVCGFDKYICALDLHHLNPAEKDPNFGSLRGWSWPRVLAEIEKCVILCKNCNSAVHAGLVQIPDGQERSLV